MLAKLIRTDDHSIVVLDKFPDGDAVARENERAQAMTDGQLQWAPLTKEDWYEMGLMGALFACVSFDGGNNHDA